MARWEIRSEPNGNLRVQYVAIRPRHQVFTCGEVQADTPVAWLIDFVIRRGNPQPFDLICWIDTGLVVPLLPCPPGRM